MIHPTTDCVYTGKKGNYVETDVHDNTDIYGVTKSLGELSNAMVIRVSIIGEEKHEGKSLLEWVKSNAGKEIYGYTDHKWNGITCLQYAKIVHTIIVKKMRWCGVRHLFSPDSVSKYELTNIINKIYELDITIHKKDTGTQRDMTLSSVYKQAFKIPSLEEQIKELVLFKLF